MYPKWSIHISTGHHLYLYPCQHTINIDSLDCAKLSTRRFIKSYMLFQLPTGICSICMNSVKYSAVCLFQFISNTNSMSAHICSVCCSCNWGLIISASWKGCRGWKQRDLLFLSHNVTLFLKVLPVQLLHQGKLNTWVPGGIFTQPFSLPFWPLNVWPRVWAGIKPSQISIW